MIYRLQVQKMHAIGFVFRSLHVYPVQSILVEDTFERNSQKTRFYFHYDPLFISMTYQYHISYEVSALYFLSFQPRHSFIQVVKHSSFRFLIIGNFSYLGIFGMRYILAKCPENYKVSLNKSI